MIVHRPDRFKPAVVSNPVAQIDVLPTLVDIAHENTGAEKPDEIDPLDGRSLLPLCDGRLAEDQNETVSEYLAEGTGAPMLMIRQGVLKYIQCSTDPEQLFDLSNDPNEKVNLVADAAYDSALTDLRAKAGEHWGQ